MYPPGAPDPAFRGGVTVAYDAVSIRIIALIRLTFPRFVPTT